MVRFAGILTFRPLWKKDQSKHEHGLAKSGIKRLNISPNKYTVYLYSVRRETGRDQGVKVPDH